MRRCLEKGFLHEYTIVSAGTQKSGKGRSGHSWESPKGSSISTSIIVYPDSIPSEKIPIITLIAGVAVSRAIEKTCLLETKIKWPNDILINEKKVCGILAENIESKNGRRAVIVGIGVNVHSRNFPEELVQKATSIDIEWEKVHGTEETNGSINIKDITDAIWEEFIFCYEKLKSGEYEELFPKEFTERLINIKRNVLIEQDGAKFTGRCTGVDETGALLVYTYSGTKRIDYGEVSVRGLLGYV